MYCDKCKCYIIITEGNNFIQFVTSFSSFLTLDGVIMRLNLLFHGAFCIVFGVLQNKDSIYNSLAHIGYLNYSLVSCLAPVSCCKRCVGGQTKPNDRFVFQLRIKIRMANNKSNLYIFHTLSRRQNFKLVFNLLRKLSFFAEVKWKLKTESSKIYYDSYIARYLGRKIKL